MPLQSLFDSRRRTALKTREHNIPHNSSDEDVKPEDFNNLLGCFK